MPEIGCRAQVLPFGLVDGGDSLADIAAEGLAAWVMRGATLAAVQRGDRRVELVVKLAKV